MVVLESAKVIIMVHVVRTWIDENVTAEASFSPNDTAVDSDCV
jgi:hypothetical protein